MDESMSAVPARVTRSRRASVESPASPARKTRTRKLKNINEKEEASVGERRNSVDDFDDAASNASSSSVKSCHVVLRRENFDGNNTITDDRSVAYSTRARRSSQLTEENISAAYSNASQRSLRSGSVISEGTESTRRSTRLAQSQNTPKKESATQPSTPARRSSRLLSETAAESPAKNTPAKITPARRNTRSSVISIASEDNSPPPPARRASSRLAEHGTPKSLKTKATKIKVEPTTPRRGSMRINKSIIATEIIDEETDEDEIVTEKAGKSKQATKLSENLIIELDDEDDKSDVEMKVIESNASKDGNKRKAEANDDDEPIVIDDAVDVKPVLTEEQKSATKETVTSSSDSIESPRVDASIKSPIPKTASMSASMSPVVLISTTTSHSPKLNASLPKAQTPTVEPSEPMEMSMTEAQIEPIGTPKGKAQNVVESSKTPQINSPKTKTVASDLDSMDVTAMVNESILSPTPSKSKEGRRKSNVSAADTTQMESEAIEGDKPNDNNQSKEVTSANVSRVEPESANDVEEMEVDTEAAPEAENNEVIEKMIVSNKPLENIKRSESSTPKSKASASAANDSFDVSPLAQPDDDSTSTPQTSKKPSKRQSLNDTVQSTGFDQMEVTILADESTKKTKNSKSATPKKMDSSEEEVSPMASSEKANTSKSSAKTPFLLLEKSVEKDMFDESSDSPKVQTPKLLRPPRESTFGIVSMSLREELDNLVSTLYTPEATTKQNDRSKVESKAPVANKEIDRQIDEIAEAITPSDPEVLDRRFEELALKSTASTSMPDEPQAADAVQEATNENMNDTTSSKDKDVSVIEQEDVSKVNETRPESVSTASTEAPPQKETATTSKSERKSVQIMTPVVDKNRKMVMKRIDTPYPDDKSITEATATANRSKSDERQKKKEELRAEARESLKKLSESWNKSIKRNSLSSESPKPIDKLGIADTSDKVEEQPAKKAVPARNKWSHLIDSESEPEEDELVPETDECETQGEEEEESENEFVDDAAEAIENYESGDSMDEEERREIEENEIETGHDIGSEDTDEDEEDEDEEDEYEDDGFIVAEGEETDASISESESEEEEEEHFVVAKKPARRSSRIIEPSSSEDESDAESIANVNEIISVSVELVPESVVVIHANPTEAEELIEGKTFPTTYFAPVDEEEKSTKAAKATESSAKTDVAEANRTLNEEKPTEQIPQENEVSAQSAEPSTSANANASIREDQNEVVSEKEKVDQPAESDKAEEKKESDTEKVDTTLQATASAPAVESDAKENQTVPKKFKHRISLPGIERLAKSSIVKKNSRVSLGDLDPNTQNGSISPIKTQSVKAKTAEKAQSKTKNRANIEIAVEKDETSTVNVSLKSDDSKNASLNTSAPEENNNNEKASKKGKAAIQTQSDENIPTESVVEISTVTSTSESLTAMSSGSGNKSKRKFIELDICEEVQQRSLKPRKLLRIVNSASGQFIEEPMTPEKNKKFGFKEIPRTPTNHAFKVEKRVRIAVPYQPRKRKSIYLNEDEDVDLLLPQPKWMINTQFEETQPKKRARKLDLGSTEVIIAPAVPTKKNKRTYLLPVELTRYRHNILNRAGIPRQNSRALLRERQKQMTYK